MFSCGRTMEDDIAWSFSRPMPAVWRYRRYLEGLGSTCGAVPDDCGGTVGPCADAPPLGPVGPDVQEPARGVPGTVGIAGFADRILSGVQYPEPACDGGAVWVAPFCANVDPVTTPVAITRAKNDNIADTKRARKQRMLMSMTEPPG